MLVDELREIGLDDAELDEHGYVYATLPGAGRRTRRWSGCSPTWTRARTRPAAGVEPLVHRDYDGGVVELPRAGTVLDPADDAGAGRQGRATTSSPPAATRCWAPTTRPGWRRSWPPSPTSPRTRSCRGRRCGSASRPTRRSAQGALLFDYERFGAVCAYTLDGSQPGELQDETFSAAEITLTIDGVDVHPGWATGKLVNAARLAARVLAALPADTLTPETTADREGFVHPYAVEAPPAARW